MYVEAKLRWMTNCATTHTDFQHQQRDPLFRHRFARNCSFHTWLEGQPDNWIVRRICGTRCINKPRFGLTEDDLAFTEARLANFSHILFLDSFQESFNQFARKVKWSITDTSTFRAGTTFSSKPIDDSHFQYMVNLDNRLYRHGMQLKYDRRIYSEEQGILF